MCTVIRQQELSSDDLAVLSARPVPRQESARLVLEDSRPANAFGFGLICLSQIVRPAETSE